MTTANAVQQYRPEPITRLVASPVLLGLIAVGLIALGTTPARADTYKYQRADGTWVFTDNPDLVPKSAKQMDVEPEPNGPTETVNLIALLEKTRLPKNALERAALAVVTVYSDLGKGSGFFISSDGYLVTNFHVLELPQKLRKRREKVIHRASEQIDATKKRVAEEAKQIEETRRRLERLKPRMRSETYARQRKEIETWQKSFQKRRAKFLASVAEFEELERKDAYRMRVSAMAVTVTVRLANGMNLRAHRVANDETWDLALLKIDGYITPALLPAITADAAVGDAVFAIGNPISLHQSVAKGVFSGRENDHLKTDAKIYPGNSGGPLVNEEGEVLGVNSFKKLTRKFEGLGFAVPIERVLEIFGDYIGERAPSSIISIERPGPKPSKNPSTRKASGAAKAKN